MNEHVKIDAPPIPAMYVDSCQSRVWAAAWEMGQKAAIAALGQGEAVAWTVIGPDDKSSIGGWQDMSLYRIAEKYTTLRDGHRYAFAYTHAPQPVVPEGFVMVPREPTQGMLEQMRLTEGFTYMELAKRYACMLAAAPTPEAQPQGEGYDDGSGRVRDWRNPKASEAGQGVDGLAEVLDEIARATKKFPLWPTDPIHALAVLGEEYGELNKAVLQHTYEPHKSTRDDIRTEAIQTAAMALRFVASLGAYIYQGCMQHNQKAIATHTQEGRE